MRLSLTTFTALAGVPIHYDRLPSAPYGSRGVPRRFSATSAFTRKLDACFAELWLRCPHGRAEVITSAGAYTEKPGEHGRGRAFDLDGIFWRDRTFVTLYDGHHRGDRGFYYGVEAILRKHFGVVLDYHYNAAHRDHFHLDDSATVGFNSAARSQVLFLQASLSQVLKLPVAIDGVYGSQSREAVTRAFQELGLTGTPQSRESWREDLTRLAERAFRGSVPAEPPVPPERNPLELLHNLYSVIEDELGPTTVAKPIEAALNAFANHGDTQEWLRRYR